ncbi:MAG: hypothetical protein HY858_05530 [Candidatus Solibacter usitatus]|nr:hypothetical protein [Candidatus Solibacter usitatus]
MTEQYPNLSDLQSRPLRYWNIDGLPELMMGLVWILWGGAFLLGESLPKGGAHNFYWMLVPAILCLSGVASNWAVKRLKQRITYPRTGFVEMKPPSRAARLAAAAVAVVCAMALAALVVRARANEVQTMISPIVGVLVSLAFLVASVRLKAPHYLALAGVSLALGLAFGAFQLGWESLNYLFIALGAACAATGALRLALFLKRHPAGAAE